MTTAITSKLTNIQQIRDHAFAGNHWQDMAAFAEIDAFIGANQQSSPAEAAEACRIMADRGMGMSYDDDLTDAEVLSQWFADQQ